MQDITVVSFEQAVAAPYCTRILGDLGARVVKVERPGTGDFTRDFDDVANGMSSYFAWVNRGKQSLSLDIKDVSSQPAIDRLLASADVVVQNLAPGSAARVGLNAANLVERFPSLIAVDLAGYGQDGPNANRRAYDLLIQTESGSCAATGWEGQPAKPGPPMADLGAGLTAAVQILSAIHQRHSDGRGAAIEVSMFDVAADFLGSALLHASLTGAERPPNGMGSPVVAPYGDYPTRDGQTVVIGTTNDTEWQRLTHTLLHRPDLADDPALATNDQRCRWRDRIDEEIGAWTRTLDAAEICELAEAAGIGNAIYRTVLDAVDHPELTERGRWVESESPVGKLRMLAPPLSRSTWDLPVGEIPSLGQHTDAILAELGIAPRI
ncbi:CaiB/BaiF CoA-transferase family protein [Aeromicrobium panaciterrae]|uniref:CaiB/BaiF CoA transferase family protein n=1 Tax=Aeromicrobium panaciterrae TaxID=363861 RepID=UPI0031D26533